METRLFIVALLYNFSKKYMNTNNQKDELHKLHTYQLEYMNAKLQLQEIHPQYYIGALKIYRSREGKILTTSTWSNFMPTILPESESVWLVEFDFDGVQVVGKAKTYKINQRKLISVLNNKSLAVNTADEPVKHFVFNEITDTSIKKDLLNQAKFIAES